MGRGMTRTPHPTLFAVGDAVERRRKTGAVPITYETVRGIVTAVNGGRGLWTTAYSVRWSDGEQTSRNWHQDLRPAQTEVAK